MHAEITSAEIPFNTLDKTKIYAKLSVDELDFSFFTTSEEKQRCCIS